MSEDWYQVPTYGPVPAGNELPDAPSFSFNGGASYEAELGSDIGMRLSLDGRHQSSSFKDALNDPLIKADGYWTLDARLSVFSEDDWDVSVWGKNITDERYVTQAVNQLSFGFGYRVYGAPRTYGLTLTKHFN